MKKSYLVAGVVIVLAVLIIVGGSLYLEQSANFMNQINQSTSSMFASSSTTQATASSTGSVKTSSSAKPVTTTTQTKTTTTVYASTGALPVISEFEPPATTIGSIVTIVGTGFDATTNYISFGVSQNLHYSNGTADNVVATVASPDGKTLSFTVPSSTASGLLCNSINKCSGVVGKKILPGNYPVTVTNKNGTSIERTITITAQ